jgi:hypothetical protein
MLISQVNNNTIPTLGQHGKQDKSQVDFASVLNGSMDTRAIELNSKTGKMSILSVDINGMTDVEFVDMLASIRSEKQARGIDVNRIPNPAQMSADEISALRAKMQAKQEQILGMIANNDIPSILGRLLSDTGEKQGILGTGSDKQSLGLMLLELLPEEDDEESDLYGALMQNNSRKSRNGTFDHLTHHRVHNTTATRSTT